MSRFLWYWSFELESVWKFSALRQAGLDTNTNLVRRWTENILVRIGPGWTRLKLYFISPHLRIMTLRGIEEQFTKYSLNTKFIPLITTSTSQTQDWFRYFGITCLSGWWMSTGGSGSSLHMRSWKGSRRGRCSRARAPLTSPPLCRKTLWQRASSLKPSETNSFT